MTEHELSVYQAEPSRSAGLPAEDKILTVVVRQALNSVAQQMKRTVIRTGYTLVITEYLDFAVSLYDRHFRLIGQAQTMPLFVSGMNFAIKNAVEYNGGTENLRPGDLMMYNWPYGTGAHGNDSVMFEPIFHEGEIVGYSAVKIHIIDIGGIALYPSDSTDVYQEGTFFRGEKIYKEGRLNEELYNFFLNNVRVPNIVDGDLKAQAAAVKTGVRETQQVIERYGLDVFEACIEHFLDHGEAQVREYIEGLPDGVYRAETGVDNNGVTEDPIRFEVEMRIEGSEAIFDYSGAPDQTMGPYNCPMPSTVAGSLLLFPALACGHESPNEGHFRPVKIITRPGSIYHPIPPAPCFLYAWPFLPAMDNFYRAIDEKAPGRVPASAGGIGSSALYHGIDKTGKPWAGGTVRGNGKGAMPTRDGGIGPHITIAGQVYSAIEKVEAFEHVIVLETDLVRDSSGAGTFRGGQALFFRWKVLTDVMMSSIVEWRTGNLIAWGLHGGEAGTIHHCTVLMPDGRRVDANKKSNLLVPEGSIIEMYTGGGGGYGDPAERAVELVRSDLVEERISREYAQKYYPEQLAAIDLG